MIILLHSKPCPFPVWVWQASILPVVENQLLYTLVCQPPLLTRSYLQLQTWDLWSRRPDVPISQECSRRPSLLWNGDSLKVPKFGILGKVAPFSQIHSYMLCFHCFSVVKWMFILKCPMRSHMTSGSSFKILYGRLNQNWEVGAFLQVALFRDSVVFTDRFCELVSSIYSVL